MNSYQMRETIDGLIGLLKETYGPINDSQIAGRLKKQLTVLQCCIDLLNDADESAGGINKETEAERRQRFNHLSDDEFVKNYATDPDMYEGPWLT